LLLGLPLKTVWQHEPANAAVEVFHAAPGVHVEIEGGPR
jgi:hypothetical protein